MRRIPALNVLIMFLFLMIAAVNNSLASEYYWVGNAGNWSDVTHWASSSGGSGSAYAVAPTATDNVHFDGNSFTTASQTVTVNATATCNNMDWTGVTNVPTLGGNSALAIYGSLTLVTANTNMKSAFAGTVTFASMTSGQTITMAGNSFSNTVTFNGVGGAWGLAGNFTTTSTITLTAGALTTNNYNMSCSEFISTGTATRSLNLGSSMVTVTTGGFSGSYCWDVSGTGMTLNAGTSTIVASGTNVLLDAAIGLYFEGGPFTYYNVNFTGASSATLIEIGDGTAGNNSTFNNVSFSANAYITNSDTFNNLTFSAGYSYFLRAAQTQTIKGSLIANGTCSAFITIQSNGRGSQSTINQSSGSAAVSYAYISDMKATGGATFTATNSMSIGSDNSGWTITNPTARNLYWIGNTGNWSDGSHWSTSSGGAASGCPPNAMDNVYFDNNSFASAGDTVTIDVAIASCNTMDWTGVTNSPIFTNANVLNIYGSLTFVPGMTVHFTGNGTIARYSMNNNTGIGFCSASAGQTINLAGHSLACTVTFNGAGSWGLASDLTNTSNFNLVAGTLSTNNYNMNSLLFQTQTAVVGIIAPATTLNLGSSTFTLSYYGVFWNTTNSDLTLNAGTSNIINTGNTPSASNAEFLGSGLTYYNLIFTGTDSAYIGQIWGNNIFHNVSFAANGDIYGANTFNDLTFAPGYSYTLAAGGTQTIDGNLNISGIHDTLVTINSVSSGTQAIFKKTSGTVCVDYINIKDNKATGGATFYAGDSSINAGDVTGWIFSGSGGGGAASVSLSGNPSDTVCPGTNIEITATPVNGGTSPNFQWFLNGGAVGSNTDTLSGNNFANGDVITCILTGSGGGCGASNTDTANFTINLYNPVAVPTISAGKTTICANDSAQLCVPSGYVSYLWNTGGTTNCVEANAAGNYYVTVTDHNNCSAQSNHLALTVYPVPSVSILVSGDTLSSYGAVAYQWYDNGIAIPGDTSSFYVAPQGGSYSVEITDSNGCNALSNNVVITAVNDLNEPLNVAILPNPSTEGWQLLTDGHLTGSQLEIYDANGRIVYRSEIRATKTYLDLEVLPGVYLLRITAGDIIITRKLLKL